MIKRVKIKRITNIGSANGQYVYDIGMKNQERPWFFANNILVHNSSYFSAYNQDIKDNRINSNMSLDELKTFYVKRYNDISDQMNATFPEFMEKSFFITKDMNHIAAKRELVSLSAVFIKKKRYSCLVYDKEDKRQDLEPDGTPKINKETGERVHGYIKAMGVEIVRSDTPKFMQTFLKSIMTRVLLGCKSDDIVSEMAEFRKLLREMEPWKLGTPKKVNSLSVYQKAVKQMEERIAKNLPTDRVRIPGHVQSAMEWNRLRDYNNDMLSTRISDGTKIIVCKLISGSKIYPTSIAYPVDETHLPEWFRELPFDVESMVEVQLDKKINNIIGVLNWDLKEKTRSDEVFGSLFDF